MANILAKNRKLQILPMWKKLMSSTKALHFEHPSNNELISEIHDNWIINAHTSSSYQQFIMDFLRVKADILPCCHKLGSLCN